MTGTSKVRKKWLEQIKSGKVIECKLCGLPIAATATGKDKVRKGGLGVLSVDHIIEVSKGGKSGTSNLQPTHQRCNYMKSDPNYRANKKIK